MTCYSNNPSKSNYFCFVIILLTFFKHFWLFQIHLSEPYYIWILMESNLDPGDYCKAGL